MPCSAGGAGVACATARCRSAGVARSAGAIASAAGRAPRARGAARSRAARCTRAGSAGAPAAGRLAPDGEVLVDHAKLRPVRTAGRVIRADEDIAQAQPFSV